VGLWAATSHALRYGNQINWGYARSSLLALIAKFIPSDFVASRTTRVTIAALVCSYSPGAASSVKRKCFEIMDHTATRLAFECQVSIFAGFLKLEITKNVFHDFSNKFLKFRILMKRLKNTESRPRSIKPRQKRKLTSSTVTLTKLGKLFEPS
jgi:hypothetical protein